MTSEEIVEAYKAKKPRASTNRAVVAELAAKSGKTVAQIRGILIFNHVYMSTPDHERFASDGTELTTTFSDNEYSKVWDEYLSADPESSEEKKNTVNDIAVRLKATPYAVERVIGLPTRPRTAREQEAEANEQALLELGLQEQRSAKRSATMRRVLTIAFGIAIIVAVISVLSYQNNPTSTASAPVTAAERGYSDTKPDGDLVTARPITGMEPDAQRRYDGLSPEGQNYVREKMKRYDEICATSSDC